MELSSIQIVIWKQWNPSNNKPLGFTNKRSLLFVRTLHVLMYVSLSSGVHHNKSFNVYIMTVTMRVINSTCSSRKSFSSDIGNALDPMQFISVKEGIFKKNPLLWQLQNSKKKLRKKNILKDWKSDNFILTNRSR